MSRKLIIEAEKTKISLTEIKRVQEKRLRELAHLDSVKLNRGYKRNGKYYYSKREQGVKGTKYLGGEDSDKVNEIKEYRYLKRSLSVIDGDIRAINNLIKKYREYDYDAIDKDLPETYRGARCRESVAGKADSEKWLCESKQKKELAGIYIPEGLKVRTSDGNYVRSKSEAIIYNYLLSINVTFAYEKPVMVGSKMYYPDFTLLSEMDYYSEIMIEHQGMMNDAYYRNHFNDKMLGYWKAGYMPGIDVFFTFDNNDGGLDITPIEDIVASKVRPKT